VSPESRLGGEDEGEALDDLPATHLDDEAYQEFLARELGADGRPRRGASPRVGLLILVLIVILLAVAVVAFR